MLVAPKLEVSQGVRPVSAHQLACGLAGLGIRKITRSGKRPKDQVTDDRKRRNSNQAYGQIKPADFIVKGQWSRLPEQEVSGFSAQGGETRAMTRKQNEQEREEQPRRSDEGRAQERRASVERFVVDVERSTAEPEDRRDGEIAGRFLEVEPFEEVECCEGQQKKNGQLKCTKVTAIEVVRTDKEHDRDRDRQRVKDAQFLNRFDLQQQMPAPAHVRRQRREQIDECNRRCSDRNKQRERVCAPKATQRQRATM